MKKILLLLTLFVSLATAKSQSLDSLQISIQIKNQPLDEAFRAIEKAYAIRFYFQKTDLPQRLVSEKFEKTALPEVLRKLLKDSGLDYFFYRNYAVAVAPSVKLNTDYSPDFYKVLAAKNEPHPAPSDFEKQRILAVGTAENISAIGRGRVAGRVVDEQTRQPIIGAAVAWEGLPEATKITDSDGKFELTLPIGKQTARIQYIGYQQFEQQVQVFGDGNLTLKMTNQATQLSEVLVKADAPDANIANSQISVAKISTATLKKLPTLAGEVDVVRGVLLSTGVTSVGEGAAGFNVRGGEIDQNLMLQDEVVLFNSSHALGFFSTYNTDLVSSIELYKSIIPAQYGGRLASVLDVGIRDGSFEKWKMKGGGSLISGRFSLEGPVVKNRASLLAGVRVSYSDWILKLMKRLELKRSAANFYDINLRYTHRIGKRDILTVGGYAAEDHFRYDNLFGFDYRTVGGQATWRHTFRETFFSRFSVIGSRYTSNQSDLDGSDAARLSNSLVYAKFREILTWTPRRTLTISAGAESILYQIEPAKQRPAGEISVVKKVDLEKETGLESAIFGQSEWTVNPNLTISGGLRLNHYRFLGAKKVFLYDGKLDVKRTVDSIFYKKGETIATYSSIEPRVSARFKLNKISSLKGGYSRTSQFVNQIFNTDTPTPTSQYQLSTNYIRPFLSHNVAGGYFRNSRDGRWEMSGELFYRFIDQLWDYRDFAKLTANPQIETEIRNGRGTAYGFEMNLKTSQKRANWQLGYTYSRAKRQIEGINKGKFYASNFDKPHILNLVVNLLPSIRHNVTFNFTYSTGRPTTAPLTSYRLQNNLIVPVYSERNAVRIPDYHRLDVSYTIGRGYNKKKTLKTSWNLSIYNLYARRNAFSVFYSQDPDLSAVANRLAIVGVPFPAISVNIETF